MKKLLLLSLSALLLVGCSKPNTVFVPTFVDHPTISTDGFSYIDSQEFQATKIDGMICLSQDEFIDLTNHLRHSRMSNNGLLDLINEFNKRVDDLNKSR